MRPVFPVDANMQHTTKSNKSDFNASFAYILLQMKRRNSTYIEESRMRLKNKALEEWYQCVGSGLLQQRNTLK